MPKRIHKSRPDQLTRLHVAEPAPLGLFGLAMGCLVLMFVDFEVTSGKLMLIPWLFLLPASLQFIAGLFDFLRHNAFGGTAFLGYSMVWYGLAAVYYLEIQFMDHPSKDTLMPSEPLPERQHTAIIFIGYLCFSIILTTISGGINMILFSILLSIDLTFFMLILHIFLSETVPAWTVGIGLLLVFVTSMYGFMAILMLKVAGGEVCPVGPPVCKWHNHIINDPNHNHPEESASSESKELVAMKKKKVNDQYYHSVNMDQVDIAIIEEDGGTKTNDEKV